MSIVGPRPQLVRDMVFMTDEQRKRHDVRPGLSGLAQVNGRNDIDWEDKLNWDLKYIQKITFLGDIKIILQTVLKAFVKAILLVINNQDLSEKISYNGQKIRLDYSIENIVEKWQNLILSLWR